MLDSSGESLVDTIARLSLGRAADLHLLCNVFTREEETMRRKGRGCISSDLEASEMVSCRVPTSSLVASREHNVLKNGDQTTAYLQYLTDDVAHRERWRCKEETDWMKQLTTWTAMYTCKDRCIETAVYRFWHMPPSLNQIYFQAVQKSYEFHPEDLYNTPFAMLSSSRPLYTQRGTLDYTEQSHYDHVRELLIARTHKMFFSTPSGDTEADVVSGEVLTSTQLLNVLHPLGGDATATATATSGNGSSSANFLERRMRSCTEEVRSELQWHHHTWLVFFMLWCHVFALAHDVSVDSDERTEYTVFLDTLHVLFLNAANGFLVSQRDKLRTLLQRIAAKRIEAPELPSDV